MYCSINLISEVRTYTHLGINMSNS